MLCNNCGKQFSDDARFCSNCGSSLSSSSNSHEVIATSNGPGIKLVPAKCTGCGASLEVDSNERAAICPFCKNAYIVDQAINNYDIDMRGNLNVGSATINVAGVSVENLLVRANDFERKNDFVNALDYYNRVLDIDFSKDEAHHGIKRIKDAIENYIYFESKANKGFSKGLLQLKKDRIIYSPFNKREETYYLDRITNLKKPLGSIQFDYPNKFAGVTIGLNLRVNKKWFDIINSAKMGEYPEIVIY